jgi:hypothetical protein
MGNSEKEMKKIIFNNENKNTSNFKESVSNNRNSFKKINKKNQTNSRKNILFKLHSPIVSISKFSIEKKTSNNKHSQNFKSQKANLKKCHSSIIKNRFSSNDIKSKKKVSIKEGMNKKHSSVNRKMTNHYIINQAIKKNFKRRLKKNKLKNLKKVKKDNKRYPITSVKASIEKFFDLNKNHSNCSQVKIFPYIKHIKIKNKINYNHSKLKDSHQIFVLDKRLSIKRNQRLSKKSQLKALKSKRSPNNKINTYTKRRKFVFHKSQTLKKLSLTSRKNKQTRRSIFIKKVKCNKLKFKCRTNSFSLRRDSTIDKKMNVTENLKFFHKAFNSKDMKILHNHLSKLISNDPGQANPLFQEQFISRYKSHNKGNFNDIFDYRALEFSQRIMDFWKTKSKNTVKEIFNYLKEELFLQSIKKSIIKICYWMMKILEDKCKVIKSVYTHTTETKESSFSESFESIEETFKKEFQVELFFDSDSKKDKEQRNLLITSAQYVGIFEEHPDKFIFDNLVVRSLFF